MRFFKQASPGATYPTRATVDSVGYDVGFVGVPEVKGYQLIYDTGISINKLPKGCFLMLAPKSSIYKRGLRLANSVGIIDPDYKDTIKVVFDMDRDISQGDLNVYKPDEDIAQFIVMGYHTEIDEINPRALRKGGFGSTKKQSNLGEYGAKKDPSEGRRKKATKQNKGTKGGD